MMRSGYNLEREPRDETLRQLMDFVFGRSARFTLHVRRFSNPPDESFKATERALEGWLLNTRPGWGRDELARGEPGELRVYDANATTADIFKRAANRLYMWRWPWLPEEPSFYRADGSAVLTTLPVDGIAWLDLTGEELTEVERRVPDLLLSRRPRKVLG
jgi:hypothetical protein